MLMIHPNEELLIPGYEFIHHDGQADAGKKSGGGLIVYCACDYDVITLETYCDAKLKSIRFPLKLPNARQADICGFYRPPDSNVDESIAELESQLLKDTCSTRHDLLLLGDSKH